LGINLDQPAPRRRQAGYLALAIAESFRDEGQDVLVLMDSVTRFAMAQREIGLPGGEPPTAEGDAPNGVHRAAAAHGARGSRHRARHTGIFTVLVDADDHNEPVADAVHRILDTAFSIS